MSIAKQSKLLMSSPWFRFRISRRSGGPPKERERDRENKIEREIEIERESKHLGP